MSHKELFGHCRVELTRPVCAELYQECKELGRFMLRYGGNTIAAGVITKVSSCAVTLSVFITVFLFVCL